jgi:DNA-directed RNA polymerase specialized sigma24 family protein
MVALYKRLQKEDIELTNSFNVYIFSIGKFTWFHHLKKISKDRALVSKETKIDYEPDIDEEFRFRLYEKHFNQLGEDCKKVLGYYFEKIPFLEVAELMGYKSEDFARRKKYLCKNQLKKMILNDPIYKEV